jgi:hypothetical protein
MMIVAEAKTRTPFDPFYRKDWMHQFALASEYGDMVSIHTDPQWNGSYDLIGIARKLTDKPILAKGLCTTEEQYDESIAAGAHQVLWVGTIPPPRCRANSWFEPTRIWRGHMLAPVAEAGIPVVINSRDVLCGGGPTEDEEGIWQWFADNSPDTFLVQASNIKSFSDIRSKANAAIIGTHLEQFVDTLKGG